MKDIESSESTRTRKEQDDANCDSKDTILRNAMDSNEATGQTEPSNGEKSSEPSSPDAKLSKLTCVATEMTKSIPSPPLNASETCSTDVEMVSPHSPTCENASACPDSESKIPNPDDDAKDISEVTEMETDDAGQNSTGAEDSNCNQASSLVRYIFLNFSFTVS